jgi:hypothetical protein
VSVILKGPVTKTDKNRVASGKCTGSPATPSGFCDPAPALDRQFQAGNNSFFDNINKTLEVMVGAD